MKFKFIILIVILTSSNLIAQKTKYGEVTPYLKNNSIELSNGGSGQFLSINYGRVLIKKEKYYVNALVGVGTTLFTEIEGYSDNEGGTTFSHQLSINIGKKNTFLEVGLTGVLWHENIAAISNRTATNSYYIAPLIGYRQLYKRMIFKIQITPPIPISGDYVVSDHYTSWLGLSVGIAFN